MPSAPPLVAAASTLAEWARARRRTWTDVPLVAPEQPHLRAQAAEAVAGVTNAVYPPVFEAPRPMIFEERIEPETFEPEMYAQEFTLADAEVVVSPVGRIQAGLQACGASVARVLKACSASVAPALSVGARIIEWLQSLADPAAHWLIRGAAIVSTMSVVMLIAINRGELFAKWDRVASMVVAATNRPEAAPVQVETRPAGTGRLIVTSSNGDALVMVDGEARGSAPVTLDLLAGLHRVLLRSPKGSVERLVRLQAGESSEVTEAIYPGWIALSTPIDLSVSESGHPLKRDERGWAILPPGPHEIHLDNRALGVHEVRHVVVTPGATTRLSFAAHTSTISLTTNESAEVWIDGTSYGKAPLVDQPIPVGLHDVRVRGAVHERWLRVRATVQPVTVNVDLTAR